MKYVLPELPFSYDALEPHIDAATMKVHHQGHHKTYVDKLNKALEPYPEFQLKVEDLLARLETLPPQLRTEVENNGGGHANHTLFWTLLAPPSGGSVGEPEGDIAKAITEQFGSFQAFKEKFSDIATKHFSNGWAWLCADEDGQLTTFTAKDHESPITRGLTPLLVIDLWEHAYYLKHQNKRPDYVKSFWNVVNWKEVGLRWSEYQTNGNTNREWRIAI